MSKHCLTLKCKQRVKVIFYHLKGTFRDLICLDELGANLISLCRYFWQGFGEERRLGSGPRITDELTFLPLAHYLVDKGTSWRSQQVGSRKLGGLDSRNLAPQRLLKSHCSRVYRALSLAAFSRLNWSQSLHPDTDKQHIWCQSKLNDTPLPTSHPSCSSTFNDSPLAAHSLLAAPSWPQSGLNPD